jgi:hypothetical protein
MEDSILCLFTEFAHQIKRTTDKNQVEILTNITYQNLQNVLSFHRQLLNKSTQEMYPIQVIIQEGNPIQFIKL